MIERLAPELTGLLEPQERFEALRRRWSLPAGRRLCDLAYANPYDEPDPAVLQALRDALASDRQLDLQYTPYGGATITRRLVADALQRSHGQPFRWRDVVLTPGAMAALTVVFRALRSGRPEGDEVIVPTPCWFDYALYLTQIGLRPVLVPLDRRGYGLDLGRIAAALGPRTRGMVLTQPGNPTGHLHGVEELQALGSLLDRANRERECPLLLVADECHRDVVFQGRAFASPIAHYPHTVLVYSFGKAHLLQGQRTGYVALSPRIAEREALAATLERLCRTLGLCTPTALMQRAVPALLALRPDLTRVARRRERLLRELGALGYDVAPSQATFFLYARCPVADDFAFAESLAQRGVLVLPSTLFHDTGHFRIALTATDEMIERAIPAFGAARAAARPA